MTIPVSLKIVVMIGWSTTVKLLINSPTIKMINTCQCFILNIKLIL